MIWQKHQNEPPTQLSILWEVLGHGLLDLFRASPCTSTIYTGHSYQVLTGCRSPQLNVSLVLDSAQTAGSLKQSRDRAAQRGVSSIILLPGSSGNVPESLLIQTGIEELESLPLMYCSHPPSVEPSSFDFQVVQSARDLIKTHSIIASAYGIPVEEIARAFSPDMVSLRGVTVFLTGRLGHTFGCVQSTVRNDLSVFWSLAVLPDQRGLGAGEFLLRSAMRYHSDRGVRHFLMLGVPGSGFRFESAGFRAIDTTRVLLSVNPLTDTGS